ncbi:pyridoxal phosphate-dependent aminotransferase [Colwellia sp. MB3u-4]|uniref:pyridoxal phosphate-dependent aminotransferase n=1 Tax=Colwellia sp. MB3u-4 TaxID=2759822 RepID=UPI0015F56565|nr:pyridoxal phosphate-dependent aminotransferase [Colwellia sp. MB3u-4]MBA6289766.1 pyridoxal phosphate-dependent aminotransferase [Colwellia sp. MB3u-4]
MPTYSLPKHIAYSQSLAGYIQHNLSDSTAQALTLAQLCQLGTAGLGASSLGTDNLTVSAVETDPIGATLLSYSPIQGDLALRQEIVKFHQGLNCHRRLITPDSAVTFCGAQEALSAIYQAVLSAGDEIVVMTPSYPSLVTMAKSMGVIVREIALCVDNHWQANIDDFKQVVNDKTQLIVLNSPHNPTGSVIDSELAKQILQLAQHYQCYLLSDDVSQASNYYDLALAHGYLDYPKSIVVGVMSKSLGLAGVRIGWAVTPNKTLLQSLMAIKAVHSICCSKIDEKLALLALQNSQEILTRNNQLIADNIALFSALVARHPEKLHWHQPQAGMLALVEVKNIDSIISWSHKLAKQSGILALPSELFGLSGNYFRLGLGQKSLANTLEIFEDYLLTTSIDSA